VLRRLLFHGDGRTGIFSWKGKGDIFSETVSTGGKKRKISPHLTREKKKANKTDLPKDWEKGVLPGKNRIPALLKGIAKGE